jgi:hypothetical protein
MQDKDRELENNCFDDHETWAEIMELLDKQERDHEEDE